MSQMRAVTSVVSLSFYLKLINTCISLVNPYQDYLSEYISEKETKQISVKVDHIYTISMKLYLGLTQG